MRAAARRVAHRSASSDLPDSQILSFDTIPYGWSEPSALASAMRQWLTARRRERRCWVTVWGLSSAHKLMPLASGQSSDLARLASDELTAESPLLQNTEVVAGAMTGGSRSGPDGVATREVALLAASARDIRAKVQPLVDAGLLIQGVTTPPLALCSIARLRRDIVPGTTIALLAIASTSMALSLVRDDLLVFAREILWGYDSPGPHRNDREKFATQLAGELRRSFLFFKQMTRAEVALVVICGDEPRLRALTAPLIMELDLEVETLDSLDGISLEALPESAESVRDHIAKFRLAWAMAADGVPPVNLAPAGVIVRRGRKRQKVALTIGVAAAVAIAACIAWMRMRPAPVSRNTRPSSTAAQHLPAQTEQITGRVMVDSPGVSEPAGVGRENPRERRTTPVAQTPQASRGVGDDSGPAEPKRPDPVVQSILYSSGRRAALVDGRIVGVGDQLAPGRVVAIEIDAVVVETVSGELRRIELKRKALAGATRKRTPN